MTNGRFDFSKLKDISNIGHCKMSKCLKRAKYRGKMNLYEFFCDLLCSPHCKELKKNTKMGFVAEFSFSESSSGTLFVCIISTVRFKVEDHHAIGYSVTKDSHGNFIHPQPK